MGDRSIIYVGSKPVACTKYAVAENRREEGLTDRRDRLRESYAAEHEACLKAFPQATIDGGLALQNHSKT